jgi:hypothetical protein
MKGGEKEEKKGQNYFSRRSAGDWVTWAEGKYSSDPISSQRSNETPGATSFHPYPKSRRASRSPPLCRICTAFVPAYALRPSAGIPAYH